MNTKLASPDHTPRRHRVTHAALCGLAFALAAGCSSDAAGPTSALQTQRQLTTVAAAAVDVPVIDVSTTAELLAALAQDGGARHIHMRAGTYVVTAPVVVPDHVALDGDGRMQFDAEQRPVGLAGTGRTTIRMSGTAPGNIISLGDSTALRGVAIEDVAGRSGNVIAVTSRAAGDAITTEIAEVEVLNPNDHGVTPAGPIGCGLVVVTLNPNGGAPPAPHVGATLSASMTRSLVRSPGSGTGCGVFAFNFASRGSISVALNRNVIGGGIIGAGAVSRPDAVEDARTSILSSRTLYRSDAPDACAAGRTGWNLQGASGMPVPLPNPGARRNTLVMHSVDDRLSGFTTGVLAAGARRFFGDPVAAPVSDNRVDLSMTGTTLAVPACDADAATADFRLAGAFTADGEVAPGDGNVLRVLLRGVTGSGARSNGFVDVLGPDGPQSPALSGLGNHLMFLGSAAAFTATNTGITPAPAARFFLGGQE